MANQFQRNKVASALAWEKYIKSNGEGAASAKDKNGILLPKLFWSTVRKNWSTDRKKNFWKLRPKAENFQNFWDH